MVRNEQIERKVRHNVFDEYTERLLFRLQGQGFFEELVSAIGVGKEANVFTARKKDGSFVIVKIYRLEACNFNKMYSYIRQDPRYLSVSNQRRKTIFFWVEREYRNLLKAREVIRVPTPHTRRDHVLVMELIGHGNTPSQLLKDATPEDPKAFFDEVIAMVEKLWRAGLVHADLSEFNIINHEERPVFIDMSQSTVTENHEAREYLRRDLTIICKHFRKLKVASDPEKLFERITRN